MYHRQSRWLPEPVNSGGFTPKRSPSASAQCEAALSVALTSAGLHQISLSAAVGRGPVTDLPTSRIVVGEQDFI